jgi:hypothetical protein
LTGSNLATYLLLTIFYFFIGINLTDHTKKKLFNALDMSRGGVLFIDEAYTLVKSHFGEDIINALVSKNIELMRHN